MHRITSVLVLCPDMCFAERLVPAIRPARNPSRKPAAIKSGGVKAASTKAATSVETAAAEAAAAAMETATPAATTRRRDVGCKHSKCCGREQRDRDFTEHD